jgi:hypothetical protein
MYTETKTEYAIGVVPVRVWVDNSDSGGYSECLLGHFAPASFDALVDSMNAWGVQGEDGRTHYGHAATGEYVVWNGALEFHITVEPDEPEDTDQAP